jgi:hypothetical protein
VIGAGLGLDGAITAGEYAFKVAMIEKDKMQARVLPWDVYIKASYAPSRRN